jgi:penicillin-binding protein 2
VRRLPFLIIAAVLLIVGCTLQAGPSPPGTPSALPDPGITTVPAPNPDETARRFLDAWKAWDYAAMYDLLSPLAQDGLLEEDFSARYEQIRRSAALSGVDYLIVSALVTSPQTAEVRFRVILQSSVVGDLTRETSMELTRERDEQDWKIAWKETTILPELEDGKGLYLDQFTPTRANIYDRKSQALAWQAEAVALAIVPNRIGGEDAEESMLSTLRRLLDMPSNDDIRFEYEPFRGTDYYIPLGEVAYENFRLVEGTLFSVGGVQWQPYTTRFYPGTGLTPYGGGYAPHTVGYVGLIHEEVLEDYLDLGYQGDEYVGQIGLEASYEAELRGEPGGTLYLLDADNQNQGELISKEHAPPYAVYTTLDRDLQSHVQQAIEDFVGAAVVLERDTGAVLAIASSPGFDPNLFDVNNINRIYAIDDLFQNPNNALLNRATLGLYPPGSVFKVITIAAALESGYYTPETIYNCGLEFRELPGFVGYDWRYEKELPASGEITLIQGLERSCNPYFWHIGLDLYNHELETAVPDMAKAFGLGQLTGIEIDEDGGLVPDPDTKLTQFGEEWSAKDQVQVSIGQSFLQVTPLQVARYMAAIGNGGTLYRPQVVLRVENAEGEVIQEFQPESQATLPISPENLEAIQKGMVNVVRDSKATAYRRFLGLSINLAGKTGTATTGDFSDPHAWFAGYTFEEREDLPDIAIAVLLEYQGEGSDWAAPVFRRIVESYFRGRPQALYPWEARIRVERTATPTPEPEELEAEETPVP